jgi:hypothetical protein
MPSLPAWVASRLALMKDEPQRSIADGRYRTVPTLPANLILNDAERAEIERYATDLDALCRQTLADGDEWLAARKELLAKEKELTRQRDALNAERRNLPMVEVVKDYVFHGPKGEKWTVDLLLAELARLGK